MSHVIRRLSTAGTRHELHHDRGIAGNMLGQVRNDRSDSSLACPARRAAADECDGLALIKRGLRECQGWSELKDEQRAEGRGPERPSSILHTFLLSLEKLQSIFQRLDTRIASTAHRRGTACRAPTRDHND